MRVFIKTVYSLLLRLITLFIPKRRNQVLFLPHKNCKNDNYDIINYQSDNVLCFINYLVSTGKYNSYNFVIRIYDASKKDEYAEYLRSKGFVGGVTFISNDENWRLIREFLKSRIVFTDNFYEPNLYKIKSQICVCLGYYAAPFKDDYCKIMQMGKIRRGIDRIIKNIAYDYHVSTSDLASQGLSLDSQIEYYKFLSLGYSRNDELLKDNQWFKNRLFKEIGYNPKYIFVYAPTHRDYERLENRTTDEHRSIFGWATKFDLQELQTALEEMDAIIIAKIHPRQERSIINDSLSNRIFFLSNFVSIGGNLQLFLSISDLLITDYSSVFYDYLLLNRPIVHYCYDFEQNVKARGFFIDPIDPFFAGDVIYKLQELPDVIKRNISNPNINEDKRNKVKSLVFKYVDGNSSQRIEKYFLGRK